MAERDTPPKDLLAALKAERARTRSIALGTGALGVVLGVVVGVAIAPRAAAG